MADDMGVTGNAILLLGFIAGSVEKDGGGWPAYRTREATAGDASITIEAAASGNLFRVSVVQIGGTE